MWSVAAIANTTKVNGSLPGDTENSNYSSTWKTIAEIFGWTWGTFGFSLAWGALMGAFIDSTVGLLAPAVGLATAIVGLILAFVASLNHNQYLTFTALAVAALSVGVDFYSLRRSGGTKVPALVLNSMTFIGDSAAMSIMIVENDKLA